jgi:hypothetical protein
MQFSSDALPFDKLALIFMQVASLLKEYHTTHHTFHFDSTLKISINTLCQSVLYFLGPSHFVVQNCYGLEVLLKFLVSETQGRYEAKHWPKDTQH